MNDPTQTCMPECMMPDGAEPCAGYRALLTHITVLEDGLNAIRQTIEDSHGVYGLHLNGDPAP